MLNHIMAFSAHHFW